MGKDKTTERDWFIDQIEDKMVKNYLTLFIEYVDEKITWYKRHRKIKGVLSNVLVSVAVVSFSMSLILIVLKSPNDDISIFGKCFNVYSSGYVCLMIASTVLLIDRLFGHSSGWIRYMMAQLEIENSISEYHAQWLNSISKANLGQLTSEDKVSLITLLSNFDNTIKSIVIKETLEWKTNFTVQLEKFRSNVDANLRKAKTNLEKYQSELKEKLKKDLEDEKASLEKGNLILQISRPEKSIVEITVSGEDLEKPIVKKVEEHQLSTSFLKLRQGVYQFHFNLIKESKTVAISEKILTVNPNKTTEEKISLKAP
ncbi:SLATT domain-containing protein [Poritiphilus flavus]|uniref:SLATT domain-containing protein n=1 Tax=Poritiphilus flavus TaxID=2697053 RepID=A0A6L9EC62_9FLAO|nr:SLATT domain-containing protein [Poritiphilus flavus]NAS12286.1 SLATT domain-containing protein [Poritiphilus flavus]